MDLLLTLSASLGVALVLGYLTQRLGLSPLVGYLLAGIIVGPNTPGFIANHEIAEQVAEIGVVLLMFGVGLHFDLSELFALRRVAVPGAFGQSTVSAALGAAAALGLGGASGWLGGIVYGLSLSVASTVVMTRVLADHDDLHTPAGHVAVGWTIVEDFLTVVLLILLPAIAPGGAEARGSLLLSLAIAGAKIAALLVVLFLVGSRAVPWLLRKVAATRSRELFTLTILVVALGIAVGSAKLFGVSIALGAFLAGVVVGRSDFSLRAASEALPMRDAFAVLFFVSVGMLFDPRSLIEAPWLVAATLGVVILGKPLITFFLARALGQPPRASLSIGLALGQIGEFSFILAGAASALGLIPSRSMSALVVVAIVSIALNPLLRLLIEPIDRLGREVTRGLVRRTSDAVDRPPEGSATVSVAAAAGTSAGGERRYRAVVVGYGPVGRTLFKLLSENGISCTIVEMNLDTVHRLRSQGIPVVYGDAGHIETLRSAGVPSAGSLILSASGLYAPEEIIRIARELNEGVRVLVRTAYLHERSRLRAAGADLVFSGEGEVALAMIEAILQDLGATTERISRERDRLRADLFDDFEAR